MVNLELEESETNFIKELLYDMREDYEKRGMEDTHNYIFLSKIIDKLERQELEG